jgi:hypothetical protein
MSNPPNAGHSNALPQGQPNGDEIPVEELIRITREFTRRITNQDRQRLALELRESGHQRSIQLTAPLTLQQFFSGEIDLDAELARRFQNAPLLSHASFVPPAGDPARRQATGVFSSQDDSMILTFETHVDAQSDVTVEVTFTLLSALGLRFNLCPLIASDRRRWLDLMRRENGIAFLWTRERWEQPYLICVVREYFARLYAFSPQGCEAAARLTPDIVTALVDWLDIVWFPEGGAPEDMASPAADTHPSAPDWSRSHPQIERPAYAPPAPAARDLPEDQWPDEPSASVSDEAADAPPGDLEW